MSRMRREKRGKRRLWEVGLHARGILGKKKKKVWDSVFLRSYFYIERKTFPF